MPLRVKLVGPLGKNPLVLQLVKPKIPIRARSRISVEEPYGRSRKMMQRTDHRAHFKRFMLGSSPLHGTKWTNPPRHREGSF